MTQEDEQLRKLVKLYGTKWVQIAAAMNRPNEACRLRCVGGCNRAMHA